MKNKIYNKFVFFIWFFTYIFLLSLIYKKSKVKYISLILFSSSSSYFPRFLDKTVVVVVYYVLLLLFFSFVNYYFTHNISFFLFKVYFVLFYYYLKNKLSKILWKKWLVTGNVSTKNTEIQNIISQAQRTELLLLCIMKFFFLCVTLLQISIISLFY